jgi:hypothetical protein
MFLVSKIKPTDAPDNKGQNYYPGNNLTVGGKVKSNKIPILAEQ